MINNVKGIHAWNKESGLLTKPENRKLESSMLLEEVLEGLGVREAKSEARNLVEAILDRDDLDPVSEVAWLDHLCDLEFIIHGGKAKMGLSPQQDNASTQAVLVANNQKLHAGQDENGKQLKPEGFVGPEESLQKILDKRSVQA